jgi:hypothetical protein
MNKDDLLLSEAYARIQNEGTGARINYMGQGVGAAASNLWQGLKAKGANALAGKHVVDAPTQTAGQAYQAAGGKWLVDDFVKKAQAEITDFYNDAKKMGVDASNIEAIKKTHPQIADQLQKVTGLLDLLKNGGGQNPQAPAGQAPAGQAPQAPAGQAPQAPAGQAPQAPATQTPAGQEDNGKNQENGQAGKFSAPLVGQSPAVKEPSTGGAIQGIPHGINRTATPGGTTNTSFSFANPSQTSPKQVNKLPEEEPVQKAFTPPAQQDAEIVNDKQKQSTAGYVNSSEGQKTLGAPKAPQQPSQKQPEVDDTFTSPKGIKYTFQPTKNGDMWVDSKGRINTSIQRNLTSGWLKQQATKSNKGKNSK